MKINNNFIISLIKEEDPISTIWEYLHNLWLNQNDSSLKEYYYKGEEKAVVFEEFILKTYNEFFNYILPKACLNKTLSFHNAL